MTFIRQKEAKFWSECKNKRIPTEKSLKSKNLNLLNQTITIKSVMTVIFKNTLKRF